MKKHLFAIIIVTMAIAIWAIAWPHLPDTIATHWNMAGEIDGTSQKVYGMLSMVCIMPALYIFLNFIVKIDPKFNPKAENYEQTVKIVRLMNHVLLVVLFIGNIHIIANGLGYNNLFTNHLAEFAIGSLFLVLGNYLPKCKPSFFIGVCTPWTLSNDEVWRRTHRFSGKVCALLGLLMISSVFVPVDWKGYVIITLIFSSAIIATVYSYVVYRKIVR